MTLDEAIRHCQEKVQEQAKKGAYSCVEEHQQLAEWLKELKAYRNKSEISTSCSDAISREAVLALSDFVGKRPTYSDPYGSLEEVVRVDDIKNLPSVTPQQKMGRWIFHEPFDNGHKNCNECIECSQCHIWLGHDCYAKTPYCPSCGAKMEYENAT